VADLRVSDQDRDLAGQQLREHFAAGRLTQDELNERVQTAYSARTQQELESLLWDLPALPATRQQIRAEVIQRRKHLQRLEQRTRHGAPARAPPAQLGGAQLCWT
jgi:histidine ammonia-lyase